MKALAANAGTAVTELRLANQVSSTCTCRCTSGCVGT